MCGIVGYVGEKPAQDVVIEGLRRLEYRGYDSAGIALVARRAGSLASDKRAGKLANLEKALGRDPAAAATTGIGHTRWATHGAPNDANAHPHLGQQGRVAVVHNGILENFAALRAELEAAGHELLSETDTEVAAHLLEIEVQAGADLTTAMQRVCQRLEGAFTLVAVDAEDPTRVVAARRNSPLVVGPRRGRELRRLRRRGLHRAHPRGARARPGPGRDDHPRGRRGHRLRRQPGGGQALPRRLGPLGRREGRLRLVHAQGDLRAAAARSPTRCWAATTAAASCSSTRCGCPRTSCATIDKIIIVGCGTAILRRSRREVRHRALDPHPVRGRAGPRVPLPRPDPDPRHPRRRHQPVAARPPTP